MFIAKTFSAAGNKDFCVTDCRHWPWPAMFCVSLLHPGGKLHSSLKNNRQPWECNEMKGQDKACQEITFSLNFFFFYSKKNSFFSEATSAIDRFFNLFVSGDLKKKKNIN